jgi:DNA primase
MVNELLVNLVNSVLGAGKRTARGNQAYTCPFCHHHKPKLEVNFTENKEGINQWACWTCGKKGKTIKSLFKQVKVDANYFQELSKLVKNVSSEYIGEVKQTILELPKEFKTFLNTPNNTSKHALSYLKKRNISKQDILKYNIGYCASGPYANRIVVPSYDNNGKLNYFTARSF